MDAALGRFIRRRLDPEEATGLALTLALGLLVLAAVGFGVVADMVASRTGLYRLDAAGARYGAAHATPGSTSALMAITAAGSTLVVVLAAAATALVHYLRHRRLAVVPFLAAVVAGQWAAYNLVKVIVKRPRPAVHQLVDTHGWSFPSGHTTAAAATWAAIALVFGLGRRRRTRVALGAGACIVMTAVAGSRVLLGVHWVTDVIGGAALGLGWFALVTAAFGGRFLRFGTPARRAAAGLPLAEVVGVHEPSQAGGDHGRPG